MFSLVLPAWHPSKSLLNRSSRITPTATPAVKFLSTRERSRKGDKPARSRRRGKPARLGGGASRASQPGLGGGASQSRRGFKPCLGGGASRGSSQV